VGFQSQTVVSIEKNFTVNLNTHEISRSGKKIQLTPMEFKLLAVLVRNRGQILSKRILLERAWGSDYVDDLDLLKKEIYRLRSKLEAEPHCPKYILCERGFGYRFVIPSLP
jgi:two-component system KDP operon response regulator KdpE